MGPLMESNHSRKLEVRGFQLHATVDEGAVSGVTTVVAATAVLWGPAGLGGPARPGLVMST